MTIDEIKILIASDESRTLELNKSSRELKDGMHLACAFLNTGAKRIIEAYTHREWKNPHSDGTAVLSTSPSNDRSTTAHVSTNDPLSSPQVRPKYAPS